MIPMGIPGASIRGHLPAGLECNMQVINEKIPFLSHILKKREISNVFKEPKQFRGQAFGARGIGMHGGTVINKEITYRISSYM